VISKYAGYGGAAATALIFGALLVLRAIFGLLECIGGIAVWRLYGKRVLADRMRRYFAENHFPPRYFRHDDCLSYLERIKSDNECDQKIKDRAKEMEFVLEASETHGILFGMRMYTACEMALEEYSPQKLARRIEDGWPE